MSSQYHFTIFLRKYLLFTNKNSKMKLQEVFVLIGKRLKELREEKKLTQEDLGRLVNLSQKTIGHYEVDRANPKTDTLDLFAKIFNTSVDYLIGRTDIREAIDNEIVSAFPSRGEAYPDLPEEAIRQIETFKNFVYEKWKGWKPGDPPR